MAGQGGQQSNSQSGIQGSGIQRPPVKRPQGLQQRPLGQQRPLNGQQRPSGQLNGQQRPNAQLNGQQGPNPALGNQRPVTRPPRTTLPPINYGEWSQFSECSVTCGSGGIKTRTRECSTGDDIDCLLAMFGESTETVSCDDELPACPEWAEWSDWRKCSASCGGGQTQRRRKCSSGNKDDCEGEYLEIRECNQFECASYTEWEQWSTCSKSCGGGGERQRNRFCSSGNTEDCIGNSVEVEVCGNQNCPEFGEWGLWGRCSKSCGGGGSRIRRRFCSTGKASDCLGDAVDTEECGMEACPFYLEWAQWSDCSRSCGGNGRRTRNRLCSSGRLMDCAREGLSRESEQCATEPCPAWEQWSLWEPCSATCGIGSTNRYRQCSTGIMADCFGDSAQQKPCFNAVCPTDSPRTAFTAPQEPNRFASVAASNELSIKVEEIGAKGDYTAVKGF